MSKIWKIVRFSQQITQECPSCPPCDVHLCVAHLMQPPPFTSKRAGSISQRETRWNRTGTLQTRHAQPRPHPRRRLPIPIGGTASCACRFVHLRHITKRLLPIRVYRVLAYDCMVVTSTPWWCYTSRVLHREDELICWRISYVCTVTIRYCKQRCPMSSRLCYSSFLLS